MNSVVKTVLITILLLAVSIGGTGLIVWAICKCFSLPFMWRYAIGIWLILLLIGGGLGRK